MTTQNRKKSRSSVTVVARRPPTRIGRPETASRLRVRDLMTTGVVTLHPGDNMAALWDLMQSRHVRHIPVVDSDGEVVGLVSHRDILRGAQSDSELPPMLQRELMRRTRIEQVMTTGVETIDLEADITEAAQIMLENKYGCLPVVEGSTLVGILTEADFVRYVAKSAESA